MSAPKEEHGEDIWTWGGSHDGRFSIKSAYDIVVEENALATDSRWSKLWNWRGPQKQIAWEPGPNEWITVNTDGSVLKQESKAAAGGIIRDHLGRGMVAFTMNLGCCTVTRAELRGAITGLELAWSYGFRNIDLQLDSRVATAILTCADDPIHQYATEVLSFRELCNREWRVEIRHVYREANKVADFLANQGHLFPFGTHLFPLSDCNLGHILRYDCLGISEPRFILIDN
ncbi:Putative ribonuclease H protein At1g65750 [Linum perenne]